MNYFRENGAVEETVFLCECSLLWMAVFAYVLADGAWLGVGYSDQIVGEDSEGMKIPCCFFLGKGGHRRGGMVGRNGG